MPGDLDEGNLVAMAEEAVVLLKNSTTGSGAPSMKVSPPMRSACLALLASLMNGLTESIRHRRRTRRVPRDLAKTARRSPGNVIWLPESRCLVGLRPVDYPETFDATEFPRVVGNEDQSLTSTVSGNMQIVDTDHCAFAFKIRPYVPVVSCC